jgi:hypothetical protein
VTAAECDSGEVSRSTSRSTAEADVAAYEAGRAAVFRTVLFALESVAECESVILPRSTIEYVLPEPIEDADDDELASRSTSRSAAEADVAACEVGSTVVSTTMLFALERVVE